MDIPLTNQLEPRIFELICFMISSANGLVRETKTYGPLRLLDSASRLISILKESDLDSPRLRAIQEQIEKGKLTLMESEEHYSTFLQELVMLLIPLMNDQ